MISDLRGWLQSVLEERVDQRALDWYAQSCEEISKGCDDARFANLISMASRYARRRAAVPSAAQVESAIALLEGWNPERWSLLDVMRVGLIVSRSDLEQDSAVLAICGLAKFADVGELCGLYRSMCFLPRAADYSWQAGEGCRSNMNEVFEAIACDNPFPFTNFEDVAWRALAVKAIFVGAPLWRVWGIDQRGSEDLAHVALDLADERRSARRAVQPELWLCLGTHGGQRAIESLTLEMSAADEAGRRAAALGLCRAGQQDLLARLRESERSEIVQETIERALEGHFSQIEFRPLHPDH